MNDEQLLRYSRHILLDEVGVEGQEQINKAKVLVFGAGGLGAPALIYLAAAGCGHITIVDDDMVDLTNLQRQVIHATDRVGMAKVESAALGMKAINPLIEICPVQQYAKGNALEELVRQATIVLDCTDNFSTRQRINAACVLHRKPLVSGSAIRWDSQVCVFDLRDDKAPCYACVYPPQNVPQEVECATLGVFAPLTGMTGTMQAAETLKLIMGVGQPLSARMLMLNALDMTCTEMKVRKNLSCPVCGNGCDQ